MEMTDDASPPSWGYALLAVFGLNVLLRMPDVLLGTFPWSLAYLWEGPLRLISLDLFALVSLLALVPYRGRGRVVRRLVIGSMVFLLVYETYEALVTSVLHRQPLLYADWSHLIGGFYLVLNAGQPWQYAVAIVAGTGLIGGLWWGLPRVVAQLHWALREPRAANGLLVVNLVVWPLVGFAAITERGVVRTTYDEICLSTTECIVHNLRASAALNTDLVGRRQATADLTYVEYDQLDWEHPPSLYLVVLESYGSFLSDAPLGHPYDRLMKQVNDSLHAAGWHTATARSRAPVFGGLSWLSVATLLLGTPVDHQPTFEAFRPTLPRYPHLVWFLRRQGYRTGLLQPPVRARPGIHVLNPFRFDTTFYLHDLGYNGPQYGWGIVPDQYSLDVVHDQFVRSSEAPFFLLFETVTTHGPWDRSPPPLLASPQDFNRTGSPTRDVSSAAASFGVASSPDSRSQAGRFFRLLRYDWHVLTDYLRTQAPPNSLVVVVGDHQPYVAQDTSLSTPLHVLSRDEALVRRFEQVGFASGLQSTPAGDTLHHAGLYSLLVRVLTAHDRAQAGQPIAPLPPYHPEGVNRAALWDNHLQ